MHYHVSEHEAIQMNRVSFRLLILFYALVLSSAVRAADAPTEPIVCEGSYRHHLQGVCADETAIYWSFTTTLVKTDRQGKVLKSIPVGNHHGDLCEQEGRLYVAVNFGKFNDPQGNADSWVFVYRSDDLKELSRHKTPQVTYGAGGVAFHDGRFFVVGGLPSSFEENYVYEYDAKFQFTKKHVIDSGHTHLGIQTATFADGKFWFGCYGDPKILLVTDASFQLLGRHEFNCSLGVERLGKDRLLVAEGSCSKENGCVGKLHTAVADKQHGLEIQKQR